MFFKNSDIPVYENILMIVCNVTSISVLEDRWVHLGDPSEMDREIDHDKKYNWYFELLWVQFLPRWFDII